MTQSAESPEALAAQIGAQGRAIAILTASLHNAGVIDGLAVASNLRLDSANMELDAAREMELVLADLIRRTIEAGVVKPVTRSP